jgi:anion-transporting  ArsA/GET3 family ATPase
MITTPVASYLNEAKELKSSLEKLDYHIDGLLFNKVHWPEITESAPGDICLEISCDIKELNKNWNELSRKEQKVISEMKNLWKDLDWIGQIPYLADEKDKINYLTGIWKSLDILSIE